MDINMAYEESEGDYEYVQKVQDWPQICPLGQLWTSLWLM